MNFISRLAEFGPMKRILKPLLGAGITPKLQQEQVDFYRAAVLLKGHAWHKSRDATVATTTAVPTQEDVDRFYREVDAMSSKDIKASVSKALEAQVTEMLRHVDTYSSSIEKAIAGAGSSSLASRGGDVGTTAKATLLHARGYDVEVRTSSVAGAGDGIFLRGRACPGTVVCFHPGLVHLAEYVSNADYLKTLLPDDDFMMIVRNDGHIVDARGATKVPFNPYALGHKVRARRQLEIEPTAVPSSLFQPPPPLPCCSVPPRPTTCRQASGRTSCSSRLIFRRIRWNLTRFHTSCGGAWRANMLCRDKSAPL